MSESKTADDLFLQVYGMTEWKFSQLLVNYERMDEQDPNEQACPRLVFKPADAAELKELLEMLEGKPRAQALLAMLMDVHNHKILTKRVEDAMPLVPKTRNVPVRKDTVGMFWAPSATLAEQSNVAST